MRAAAALEVKGLTKSYGGKQIFSSLSFTISSGETVGLLGRNGTGKTTLLQILAGLLKPDAGEIQYFGQKIPRGSAALSKVCGYLPQENPLLMELSVQDNLSLFTGRSGRPAENLISMFHLEEILNTPVKRLSGGMKRRVSICASVCLGQPLLLMDEPTAALDMEVKREIREWFLQYKKLGGTLLIATHDEEEIRALDRCLKLESGSIIPL